MTKIVKSSLPHAISSIEVKDAIVRKKVMFLVENIAFQQKQIESLQDAVLELQRRK